MVEQGQEGVGGGAEGPAGEAVAAARLLQHCLDHTVGVELHQLKEVDQQAGDIALVLRQGTARLDAFRTF